MKAWSVPSLLSSLLSLLCLLGLAGLGLWSGNAAAFTCTSAGGNWATVGTWSACNGTVPQSGDTVVITGGTVVLNTNSTISGLTLNGGILNIGNNTTVRTLTVNGNISVASGATVRVNNSTATYQLNVSGDITNNGTFDLVRDANSRCATSFTGAGTQTIGGTSAGTTEFYNVTTTGSLTINKTAGAVVTQTGTLGVGGALTVQAGTYNLANTAAVTGATNVSGTLGITSATGTKTFTGAVTVNAGGTWSNTANGAVTMGSNLANNGTFASGTGTYTFTGATQWTGSGMTFAGPVVANSNLTVNVSGTVTQTGTLSVAGDLAVQAGTHNLANTATITGTTSVSGTLGITSATGTKTFAGAVSVNPGGIWSNTADEAVTFRGGLTHNGATFTAGTGVHLFDTTAAQSIAGSSPLTIPNVTVNTPTVLTNTGTLTVSTALVGTGNFTNAGTLNIGGTSTVTGFTADAAGNTVNYTGTGAQTVRLPTGGNYWHLGFSNAGTKTLPAGPINVLGDITVNATSPVTGITNDPVVNVTGNFTNAGTYTKGDGTLSVGGNFSNNGTFTATAGTVALNGTAAQAIGGTSTTTFINLTIANTSAAVSANTNFNITAAGTLTVNANAVLAPAAAVVINNAAAAGTVTGSGTLQVTRILATADYSSQYRFTTNTLTNLTVEYIGAAAQTASAITYGGLKINNASGCTVAAGTATVGGTLTLTSGPLNVAGNTLALNGPAIQGAGALTNLVTTSSSNLSFGGSSVGVFVPGSVLDLNNLTINNASDVALNSSPTIAGTLFLTSGVLATGLTNSVNVTGNNCPGSYNRPGGGGYVNGKLRLKFPSGGATCTFHIGSGSVYAPVTLTTPAASTGGTLTGRTTGNEHPNIATSGIDEFKDVNRYWTLWASGDNLATPSYDASFNFIAGDVDVGATPTSFVLGKHVSGGWTLPSAVTAGATSIAASGIPGPLNATTDFAAGEVVFVCAVPLDLPAGMSCECDNFNRASVNPSTIFGGNFLLSQSSGTPGWPQIANLGLLQMTNNSGDMATSATVPGTFPAAGNLVSVEFRHYAYRTGGGAGADGMAVTLSDSLIVPVAGAFGGSLGYAQKTIAGGAPLNVNGFAGGWIGIGIDEWGNFSAPTEGRVGGPAQTAQSVAIRGSGSGLTGYPYLGGTGGLTPVVDDTNSATPARGHAYRVQVDARCYQNNSAGLPAPAPNDCATLNPSAARYAQVRVYRDTTGLGSFGAALVSFEAYQAAIAAGAAQADVPGNWKLSYTGTTGGSTNIHELGALKVCAQTITPPAGYRIQVDNLTPSTCGTPAGPIYPPVVKVTALNTNGNPVLDYDKTVTLSAPLSGGGASSAVWSLKTGTGTFTAPNQYKYEATDLGVAEFYLTDASPQSVTVTVSENGGTISSSLAPPPIVYSGGSFTIANIDTLGAGIGGGVVAGRAHLMSVTRSNGCVTDTSYTGAKNLDGWYTPSIGDHPAGALAPQLCATNVGDTCLPATGACQTLSIAPPTVDPGSNNMPTLTFASGIAKFCIATSDVGKYSVSLRDDSATPVVGSSGTLTARPFAVAVRDVSPANPAGSGPASAIFASAGTNFSAGVSGYLWASTGPSTSGSGDTDGNGVPDSAATFAEISVGGLAPAYADTVALAADTSSPANFTPTAPPATAGLLGGGAVAVAAGSGTQNGLNYDEVGSFTLKATPATSYLNSGVDLADRVAVFAGSGNARTAVIGRFIPHHFGLAGSVVNRSDLAVPGDTFTYMDEPMKLSLVVTAYNKNEGMTQNYAGSYAKLEATTLGLGASWFNTGCTGATQCMGLGAVDGTTGLSSRLSIVGAGTYAAVIDPTSSWAAGVGSFTAHVKLARKASAADWPDPPNSLLDGPYDTLKFGGMPRDSEGVSLLTSGDAAHQVDFDATTGNTLASNPDATNERREIFQTGVRFGRLWLGNACGSDKRDLSIPFRAEYWNGNVFITNPDDSLTSVAKANIGLGNHQPAGFGASVDRTHIPAGPFPVGSGLGSLSLLKPTGSPAAGSVDVVFALGADTTTNTTFIAAQPPTAGANLPYLRGKWYGTSYDRDAVARAAFGIYCGGGSGRGRIYLRESY